MAMPFTTPFAKPGEKRVASRSAEKASEPTTPAFEAERGLQEAPRAKRPQTFWAKLWHAFDFGNKGDQG